jgi:hypothetical protein
MSTHRQRNPGLTRASADRQIDWDRGIRYHPLRNPRVDLHHSGRSWRLTTKNNFSLHTADP